MWKVGLMTIGELANFVTIVSAAALLIGLTGRYFRIGEGFERRDS